MPFLMGQGFSSKVGCNTELEELYDGLHNTEINHFKCDEKLDELFAAVGKIDYTVSKSCIDPKSKGVSEDDNDPKSNCDPANSDSEFDKELDVLGKIYDNNSQGDCDSKFDKELDVAGKINDNDSECDYDSKCDTELEELYDELYETEVNYFKNDEKLYEVFAAIEKTDYTDELFTAIVKVDYTIFKSRSDPKKKSVSEDDNDPKSNCVPANSDSECDTELEELDDELYETEVNYFKSEEELYEVFAAIDKTDYTDELFAAIMKINCTVSKSYNSENNGVPGDDNDSKSNFVPANSDSEVIDI